ncbi:MAG: hypothetical protein M3237_11360 [Actinomycetota bacterium]|nr:hypothetical protein [Actinomycetota bacterium]
MTGSIGPNSLRRPVGLTLKGSLSRGLLYRDVQVAPGGDCVVRTRAFSCSLVLSRGRSAELRIILFPDRLTAPATGEQRLSLASSSGEGNEATSTLDVDRDTPVGGADTGSLSPAPQFVILLALFMFALAAGATERRLHRPGD